MNLREKITAIIKEGLQTGCNESTISIIILEMPELQEAIADAERYREMEYYGADDKAAQVKEWKEKADQFDKLFEELVVKDECGQLLRRLFSKAQGW